MARRWAGWLAYSLALLLFFEGSARLALGNEAFLKRVSGNDDATWRRRWLERHAKLGTPISYAFDEWNATLGWTLKPNLRDVDAYGGKFLNTNAHGLRGSVEHGYEKPPGAFRIVVLGDSFTFGEGVGDEETYSHVLQELLPQVEVLNLGVHGYGHDQMLLYLKEEGLRYKPDLILLGFLTIDMERNILAFRDYAKPRFVLREGQLLLTHSPVPPVDETLAAAKYWPRFFELATTLHAGYRFRSGAANREAKQVTLAILDELHAAAEATGAKVALAYLPAFGELTKPDLPKTLAERFFFGYCEDRKIPAIYLRPYFLPKLKQGADFNVYGHWGALEHRIAGEGIAAELLARGLVPKGAAN